MHYPTDNYPLQVLSKQMASVTHIIKISKCFGTNYRHEWAKILAKNLMDMKIAF